jgi:hypothetical protein
MRRHSVRRLTPVTVNAVSMETLLSLSCMVARLLAAPGIAGFLLHPLGRQLSEGPYMYKCTLFLLN